jgi:hypothetical protein
MSSREVNKSYRKLSKSASFALSAALVALGTRWSVAGIAAQDIAILRPHTVFAVEYLLANFPA